MSGKRKTSDGLEIVLGRYYRDPERLASLEEARAKDQVARKLLTLREQAGLTQKQLAQLVGTAPSVISRLEDADYEGHSLSMLRRIAAALNKNVEIRFVPKTGRLKAA